MNGTRGIWGHIMFYVMGALHIVNCDRVKIQLRSLVDQSNFKGVCTLICRSGICARREAALQDVYGCRCACQLP